MNSKDALAAIIQVLMAIGGAFARILNDKDSPLHLNKILGDLFVSGFTGLLLYWVTHEMDLNNGWIFSVAGIAGWIGPHVLDSIANLVRKKTGLEVIDAAPKAAAVAPAQQSPESQSKQD